MDNTWTIKGLTLEFLEDCHQYLVQGVMVDSITQILSRKYADKYADVSPRVLKAAADKGTEMHSQIERFCKEGVVGDMPEVRNFAFLQKQYKFEVLENEVPVILFDGETPVAAGRLDMIINMDGKIGLVDLKRTSVLDKAYLADQLNLYRIALRQSTDVEADFLRGIHLRENVRKFVPIPINEDMALQIIKDYLEGKYDTENQQ